MGGTEVRPTHALRRRRCLGHGVGRTHPDAAEGEYVTMSGLLPPTNASGDQLLENCKL